MKLRHKGTLKECSSHGFNIHSYNEILIGWEDGGMDSDYIRNYEIWINDRWMLLTDAFKEGHLEIDEHHTTFWQKAN